MVVVHHSDGLHSFGVSYAEFQRLRGEKPEDNPFVLALPVRRGGEPAGVVALDAPAYMGEVIREAVDVVHYLQLLGTLVLDGDDRAGSVGAQRHP